MLGAQREGWVGHDGMIWHEFHFVEVRDMNSLQLVERVLADVRTIILDQFGEIIAA
jgi:hypothetical protein